MTQANDSILVTPGSGATVATHLVSAKEYQVLMKALASGHIEGTEPIYVFNTGSSVHVAAASTLWFDLFNADATLVVRVISLVHVILVEGGVTGVGIRWEVLRTTAVGTGGTALTGRLLDTTDTALDADITARLKATGGATASDSLLWYNRSVEETVGPVNVDSPDVLPPAWRRKGIVLRQNQGIRINQASSTAVGNSAIVVSFTVE